MSVQILQGDCREILKTLPADSVDCIVTSPPYYGLRDYGVAGQIGLEETPDAYVKELVSIFRDCRRVLKSSGVMFLNLGDSYSTSGARQTGRNDTDRETPGGRGGSFRGGERKATGQQDGLKPKDLIGIPWLVAFALRADGWVLRQEIIWQKPNPMPESVQDRCTKSHEQIFMFAKAKWSGPEPGRFSSISDQDARWLAALIDAEGSIVVKRCKHEGRADTFAPQVSMGGTSRALMEEFARIAGHGNLMERPGLNAPMLCWQVANGIARDFLLRIYPWLIVKQRQARIGIYVDSLTYWRGGKKLERKQRSEAEHAQLVSLWERNKLCNQFGDPDLSDVPEPKFGRWSECARYFYDAGSISEEFAGEPYTGRANGAILNGDRADKGRTIGMTTERRNRRSVWTVSTQPFSEAHFATFPSDLIEPCIKAGCPEGGTVFDPFGGAGTTGLVADRLQRNAILIELNPAYATMAQNRISNDAGMFGEVAFA